MFRNQEQGGEPGEETQKPQIIEKANNIIPLLFLPKTQIEMIPGE